MKFSPKRLLVLLVCLAIFPGCGGGSGQETVVVSGIVTFDGGDCPGLGKIIFVPIEIAEGRPRRPATAKFDTDGSYTATSFREGDGLIPGRYRVTVQCLSGIPPERPGGMEEVSYIAPGYKPDDLVVAPDAGPIELNLDVPLKK